VEGLLLEHKLTEMLCGGSDYKSAKPPTISSLINNLLTIAKNSLDCY